MADERPASLPSPGLRPVVSSRRDGTEHLVVQAKRGDEAAFERLYERHRPAVRAVVLRRVALAEVEDVVQEAFATAWLRLPSLRFPGSFASWLLRIARHAAVDQLRRRRPGIPLDEELPGPSVPHAEAREAIEAIRALPDAYSETLLMRLVEGLTGPEIATLTGRTPGSVRVNLHRGMALLRERLGVEGQAGRAGKAGR